MDNLTFNMGAGVPSNNIPGRLSFSIDGTTGSIYLDRNTTNNRVKFNADAKKLETAVKINNTDFDGSGDITTEKWGKQRDFTIGNSTISVDGSDTLGYTWTHNAIGVPRVETLSGLGTDYTFRIIPLCLLDNGEVSRDSYFMGHLFLKRANMLSTFLTKINIVCGKNYNQALPRYSMNIEGGNAAEWEPVTFTWNSKKYFGLYYKQTGAGYSGHCTVTGHSSDWSIIKVIDVYNHNTSTILNAEVYNSIATLEGNSYHLPQTAFNDILPRWDKKFNLGAEGGSWRDTYTEQLYITGTSGIGHITFGRLDSYNYLHVPGNSGAIALCANETLAVNNCSLVIDSASSRPGKNDTFALGTETYKWKDAWFSGTVTIAKNTDASGTANNKPALIVGGLSTEAHLEMDNNELMAKKNGTTVVDLYLNSEGGLVHIGSGGLQADGSDIVALSTNADFRAIKATNSNGSVGIYAGNNRGLYDFTKDGWIIYRSGDGTKTYVPHWGTKGSSSLPAYFSGGEPVACTPENVFSDLDWSDGTTIGPTLTATIATKTRVAIIPTATVSRSGVVNTSLQRFRGKKLFEYPAFTSNDSRYLGWHYYHPNGNTTVGEHWYDIGSNTNITTGIFNWRQYSPNSTASTSTTGYYETFYLPSVTVGRTSNASYEIFTSKSYTTLDSRYVTLSTTQTISGTKTFTNPPVLSNATYYGSIRFAPTKTNGSRLGEIYCMGTNTDALTGACFNFRIFSYTSDTYTPLSTYESYTLPMVSANRSSSITYEIFTSKNYATLDARYVTLSTAQTISGNKTLTGRWYYKTTNYTSEPIRIQDDGTSYGHTMTIGAGGTTYVGAGESATGLLSKLAVVSTEDLILGADSSIKFYANADNATATSGITLNTSNQFYPQTTGAGSIGTSSYRWGGIYSTAANISGTVTANATTLSGALTANSVSASSYDGCCKIYKHSWANGTLAAGWYRIAKIAHVSGGGYSTGIIITHGGWDSGEPTSAVFVVSGVHNTPMITQIGGTVGEITQMRLTGASGGYYLEAYKATDTPSGSNFSTQYLTLIGNFNPTFYTPTSPNGAVDTNSAYVKVEDRGNINYGSTAYANPRLGDIWLKPV